MTIQIRTSRWSLLDIARIIKLIKTAKAFAENAFKLAQLELWPIHLLDLMANSLTNYLCKSIDFQVMCSILIMLIARASVHKKPNSIRNIYVPDAKQSAPHEESKKPPTK